MSLLVFEAQCDDADEELFIFDESNPIFAFPSAPQLFPTAQHLQARSFAHSM
jgi:hypothetical protein